MEIADSSGSAEHAALVIYIGAICINPIYLHFILSLLEEENKTRGLWITTYAIALVELFLLFGGWLLDGVQRTPNGRYYEVPGPMYGLFFATWLSLPALAIVKLTLVYRRTEAVLRKNQFKYVIYSSLTGFFAGATSFFPFFTTYVPPFAAPVTYFYTFPITYAVARYRLLGVDVVIKRSVIYAILLTLLLIPCFLIVIVGQMLAFGSLNYNFSLATLLLFIVVGFLFPKLRFKTEDALERALFQKRVDHRDTLIRSSKDMVSIIDLDDLCNRLVRTVSRAFEVTRSSLYLLDDTKATYNIRSSTGIDETDSDYPPLSRSDPLVQWLSSHYGGVVKEEQMVRDIPNAMHTADRMSELKAEVSLPIISKEKLIGILNLGHKAGKEIYSNEDLELLSTLTNQAAIAIENARLYQNLKQSQDTLRRADRLSSLGLLTAGLAHEIRNPLVAIRTFTQLLPERYEDAEFRNGFQSLALKEVDRICGLITDLLSFARPSRPNVAQEDMNTVIDGIARILDTQAKEKSVELIRDFAPNLPKVWIDREQMKQVFMNLIFNGIQAMNNGGTITISTRIFTSDPIEQSPSFVQVEVRDTGIGIPNEDLEHIFDPFFTSKDEGSGLGLSISHQIVQEHGGYVTVESKVGKGTSFLVNIPTGKPVRAMTERNLHVHEANLSH
jgi:two-component system, NtrC family, sensor kinase